MKNNLKFNGLGIASTSTKMPLGGEVIRYFIQAFGDAQANNQALVVITETVSGPEMTFSLDMREHDVDADEMVMIARQYAAALKEAASVLEGMLM